LKRKKKNYAHFFFFNLSLKNSIWISKEKLKKIFQKKREKKERKKKRKKKTKKIMHKFFIKFVPKKFNMNK
jgi:hypothetical protein